MTVEGGGRRADFGELPSVRALRVEDSRAEDGGKLGRFPAVFRVGKNYLGSIACRLL